MPELVAAKPLNPIRLTLAALLGGAAIALVVLTWRWPLVWDSQVMHYIHFLIDHGFAPYRDITDINMPGEYVFEGWAMRLFGGSDLAWRLFDFTLLGLLTLAMAIIARPYDWLAGLFAGVLFWLIHASNGPWNSVERDEQMTVLLVIGYALLFESVRRAKPWLLGVCGFSMGLAASIKPTIAPLAVLLLAFAVVAIRRRVRPVASSIAYGIGGAALATAVVFSYLFRYHAAHTFFAITSRLTPFYATLEHTPLRLLARTALPKVEWLVAPFAVVVALRNTAWKNWERWALLAGVAAGGFSYFVQGKGYEYHKYPFTAFALLWMGIELSLAMRMSGWRRVAGIAGLTAGIVFAIPFYLVKVYRLPTHDDFTTSLEQSLAAMGTARLQHQVQCLDLVEGCYTALYHLKIVQASGLTGDLLLFMPATSPVVDEYRSAYWSAIGTHPPAVFVLANDWFGHLPSFDKLQDWPDFAHYLDENYRLVSERSFHNEADHAWRIYVRKGSTFSPSDPATH